MTIIRVDVRADETSALLLELQRRTGDIRPAMEGIAQILASNTQLRFVDQKDPDGNPWAPLSPITLSMRRDVKKAYISSGNFFSKLTSANKQVYKAQERLNKAKTPLQKTKAEMALNDAKVKQLDARESHQKSLRNYDSVISNVKILRDTGRLANSINARVEGGSVLLGTNVTYAITHQQGAKKGQYGRSRRGGPIPWGNVPARPFFGYSDQDQADVLELLQRYVDASQPQSWWMSWLNRFRRLF